MVRLTPWLLKDDEDIAQNKTEKKFLSRYPGLTLLYKVRIKEDLDDTVKKFMSWMTLTVYLLMLLFTCKLKIKTFLNF